MLTLLFVGGLLAYVVYGQIKYYKFIKNVNNAAKAVKKKGK